MNCPIVLIIILSFVYKMWHDLYDCKEDKQISVGQFFRVLPFILPCYCNNEDMKIFFILYHLRCERLLFLFHTALTGKIFSIFNILAICNHTYSHYNNVYMLHIRNLLKVFYTCSKYACWIFITQYSYEFCSILAYVIHIKCIIYLSIGFKLNK